MNDAPILHALIGVVRRHPDAVPLVCPCGGTVVLGGHGPDGACFCAHENHHSREPCYRPSCRCPGLPEDHPAEAVYRCTSCGVVRLSLVELIPQHPQSARR